MAEMRREKDSLGGRCRRGRCMGRRRPKRVMTGFQPSGSCGCKPRPASVRSSKLVRTDSGLGCYVVALSALGVMAFPSAECGWRRR